MISLANLALVACGGAIGACLRYTISEFAAIMLGRGFPYGTLIVNVVGSFIMGVVFAWLMTQPPAASWVKPVVGVGLLGALTTFSTFSMDTLLLFQQGDMVKAFANVLINVIVCISVAYLGTLLVKS